MMLKNKKLVIVGDGEFADIAYEYFTFDSDYTVTAFAVEHAYRKRDVFHHLPVIDLEELHEEYPPDSYQVFVAVTYVKLNRIRRRLFLEVKHQGYHCASYVSSHAFVWHNVKIGENVFVFENNTLQHNVIIEDDVVIWSGNHVGHRSIIESHCWIASCICVSGFCHIGQNSFLGVNSTLGDNVIIPRDTVLAAGAVTVKSLREEGMVYMGLPAKPTKSSYEQFGIDRDE